MACPVCFGESSEPMALAMNAGIWFMLGIVVAVLAAFATFFIHLVRRARLAARDNDPADAGQYARGQEGTA
jgi:hypothetical protein